MARPELPSFDLVVATVGRVDELDRFLGSLERQTHPRLRVLLVEQNRDDRLEPVVAAHPTLDVVRLRVEKPGLARARNRALGELRADLVAFPDDDCEYADDLLERVARRFAGDPALEGLCGRTVASDGSAAPSWKQDPAILTDDNLWNRANSGGTFLHRAVVQRMGSFDEELGLGSGNPWSSGEEIDFLVRSVRAGARIVYDPALTVTHDAEPLSPEELRARGYRDGASVGYILRKHGYPARVVARMLVRPIGGALVSLVRGDPTRSRFHLAMLRGRLAGYRRGPVIASARAAP